jgi:hypothetical protein
MGSLSAKNAIEKFSCLGTFKYRRISATLCPWPISVIKKIAYRYLFFRLDAWTASLWRKTTWRWVLEWEPRVPPPGHNRTGSPGWTERERWRASSCSLASFVATAPMPAMKASWRCSGMGTCMPTYSARWIIWSTCAGNRSSCPYFFIINLLYKPDVNFLASLLFNIYSQNVTFFLLFFSCNHFQTDPCFRVIYFVIYL